MIKTKVAIKQRESLAKTEDLRTLTWARLYWLVWQCGGVEKGLLNWQEVSI